MGNYITRTDVIMFRNRHAYTAFLTYGWSFRGIMKTLQAERVPQLAPGIK